MILIMVLDLMMMMMMIVSIAVLILAQRLMVLMMIVTIVVALLSCRTLMVIFTSWRIALLLFNDGLLQVEHWKLIPPIQTIPLVTTTVGRSITAIVTVIVIIVAIICMVLQCWIQCRYAGWMQCIASMSHTTGGMVMKMMRRRRIHDTGPTLIVTRQAPTSRSGQIGQQFAW